MSLLGAQREGHGLLGGERVGLVERVGVQRLRAAQHRGQRLEGGADHVVVRLLRGEGDPGGLRVGAELPAPRVAGAEAVAHHPGPDAARGAELGDLLEEVVVDVPEEGQARREVVHRHAPLDALLDVADAVGEGEGQLLDRRRPCLADVVAADRDRVPARHVPAAELDHVDDDAHRRPGRNDPLLLGDVLLQHVVLNGARRASPWGRPASRRPRCTCRAPRWPRR